MRFLQIDFLSEKTNLSTFFCVQMSDRGKEAKLGAEHNGKIN